MISKINNAFLSAQIGKDTAFQNLPQKTNTQIASSQKKGSQTSNVAKTVFAALGAGSIAGFLMRDTKNPENAFAPFRNSLRYFCYKASDRFLGLPYGLAVTGKTYTLGPGDVLPRKVFSDEISYKSANAVRYRPCMLGPHNTHFFLAKEGKPFLEQIVGKHFLGAHEVDLNSFEEFSKDTDYNPQNVSEREFFGPSKIISCNCHPKIMSVNFYDNITRPDLENAIKHLEKGNDNKIRLNMFSDVFMHKDNSKISSMFFRANELPKNRFTFQNFGHPSDHSSCYVKGMTILDEIEKADKFLKPSTAEEFTKVFKLGASGLTSRSVLPLLGTGLAIGGIIYGLKTYLDKTSNSQI